jgi:predicted nucleic acid-binding protein
MLVLLDTSPLGLAVHPNTTESKQVLVWLQALVRADVQVRVPAIADYELRRELMRIGSSKSLHLLDRFCEVYGYLPLTKQSMLLAASYWADLRKMGRGGTQDKDLDGDVILAAQAAIEAGKPEYRTDKVIIATENLRHFSHLPVNAAEWKRILP